MTEDKKSQPVEVVKTAFSTVIDIGCVTLVGVFAYKGFRALGRWIER
jgi:hypothetical protein